MLTVWSGIGEELSEESHHGLCALAAVPLDVGELGRQEVVKILRPVDIF